MDITYRRHRQGSPPALFEMFMFYFCFPRVVMFQDQQKVFKKLWNGLD